MNITNERKVPYAVFDLEDLTSVEIANLREIGLREIQKDDEALIQYGVEVILRQFVGNLENNVKRLKNLIKKEKK